MKTCFKCHKEKKLSEFYVHHRMSDGHLGKCIECAKKDAVEHRNSNLERIKAYDKKRSMLPHRVETRKLYAKEHSNQNRIRANCYYEAHKNEVKEYREINKDVIKIKRKVYRKKYADWICGICGRKINRRLKYPNPFSISIDHIIPLSKGGNDSPVNVQATHLRCNIGKHARNVGQLRMF